MSDILEIKSRLNGQALEAARDLLPQGVLHGHDWCVGSISGEAGESLKVCVSGRKVGMWADFAPGGESGDLIDLWCLKKNKELPAALDEIRSWLGMEKTRFQRGDAQWAAKGYKKPGRPKGQPPIGPVKSYLINTRNVSSLALQKYRVGEHGREMVFQSLIDGEAAFIKYLSVDRTPDGKKITRVEPDCEPVLFGWQAIESNAREITITEGEIDALTSYDYGWPALSVPFGGGKGAKQRWIESEFDRLQRFEVIYLVLDDDPEGEAAVSEIVPRLGRHRCRRVKLPRKDMNQCRMDGIRADEIKKCFEAAKTQDPSELRRAGEYTDNVISLFWPKNGEEKGYRLPFENMRNRLIFRPAEMTIWTGPSGSGKSQILSNACVGFKAQGARICMASFEMVPGQTLRRMVKQAGNVDRPTEPYIRAVMNWLDEGIWFVEIVGKTEISKMLEVFEYARARYGCDVFVADSLMRLGVGSEDYEGQERAVYEIVDWTVKRSVHTHLVAHARKGNAQAPSVPEIDDVKGAQEIGANAFNIVGIWRNRKHEDAIRAIEDDAAKDDTARRKLDELVEKPTVVMNLAKQRNGDWEGKCGLWFDQSTYQYRASRDSKLGRQYVDYSEIAATPGEAA